MIYHTPVRDDKLAQITPTSGSLGSLGLPLTDVGAAAAQLTSVAGISAYEGGVGLNQLGAVGALQTTDAPANNGFVS